MLSGLPSPLKSIIEKKIRKRMKALVWYETFYVKSSEPIFKEILWKNNDKAFMVIANSSTKVLFLVLNEILLNNQYT